MRRHDLSARPAHRASLARSIALFRAFLVEQTDPDHFYSALARDSVAQLATFTSLEDRTIVDVGGGPGYFAREFQRAGATYLGLDPDAGELPVRRTRESGMVRASGTALPIADRAVDVCYSSNVLEHVARPFTMLDEMLRVTRSGGVVFVAFTPWFAPWGGHETAPMHYCGGHRARRHYQRKHGHEPKNKYGQTLFARTAGAVLRWARANSACTVLRALPRYHPWWACWVARVPVLREVASWNIAVVLRKL